MKSKIHDLGIYSLSMELGEEIWKIVLAWDFFARDTVGKQWVRAIDSVASNISEGYGRYSYIEMRKFITSQTNNFITKSVKIQKTTESMPYISNKQLYNNFITTL